MKSNAVSLFVQANSFLCLNKNKSTDLFLKLKNNDQNLNNSDRFFELDKNVKIFSEL